MRIAICEDEAVQQEYLQKLLSQWARERAIPLETAIFPSGESFAFAWEEDKAFDLLILDIEMGSMNGMEVAERIRRTDQELPILFITGYTEYMGQGYDVAALHYLLKPVHRERLFTVLDRLQQGKRPEEKLVFQGEEGVLSFPASQSWYIEASGHQCILHAGGREWLLCQGISQVEKYLAGRKEWVRCHRSYLVNLQHICAIMKSELVLDDGQRLPLSRQCSKEVNGAFIRNYQSQP